MNQFLTTTASHMLRTRVGLVAAPALGALLAFASACSSGPPAERTAAAVEGKTLATAPAPSAPPPSAAPPAALVPTANALPLPLAEVPTPSSPPVPHQRTPEDLLRAEVASWKKTPYREDGTSRAGIGNAQFVRAVYRGSFDVSIPDSYEQQIRTGKLATRDALEPGDLVFFEGKGIGPFRSKSVGIFLGKGQMAIADKDGGVVVAPLAGSKWDGMFKTARRMPVEPNLTAPSFDVANYGSTAELLREVAKAWSGTLYKQGGTTFDGIGNDEFVRSIYEAIYDTELEGTPKEWATAGKGVKRDALQAGDIVLYEAVGVGKLINQRHAGLYISNGEFVHAVKGSAVTISKLSDPRWSKAFVAARRIDPDQLARVAERRAHATAPLEPHGGRRAEGSEADTSQTANDLPRSGAVTSPPRNMSEYERQLRDATEPWKGTPYKLGGTTKSGVDCSAFVRAVYQDVYGVALPRTAEEQERLGAKIDRKNLATGDLIFFRTQGMGPLFKSRHVGIYLGDGEFAQAAGRLGVHVARLDAYYWSKKYEGARRLAKS